MTAATPQSLSTRQSQFLSIIPIITGTLSIVGSSAIIYWVLRRGDRRGKVYHQLLLGMSCCDVAMSFGFALSTWPVPQWYHGAYGARGNSGTCTAQGFVLQMFGLAVPIYNASLAIYYLLVFKYRWQESRIRRMAAPWMHAVAVTLGLATAIACLLLKLFNPMDHFCWIAPLPNDCKQSYQSEGGGPNCVRGDNADIYALAFVIAIVWVCIFLATVAMLSVFLSVLKQERAVARYRYNGDDPHRDNLRRSKQVARQALLYVLAFVVTWLPATVHTILILTEHYRLNTSITLAILELLFLPLQGFFNALVYFRPLEVCRRYSRRNNSIPSLLRPAKRVKAKNRESNNPEENKASSTVSTISRSQSNLQDVKAAEKEIIAQA